MNARNFALYGGIVVLVMGLVALVPTMVGPINGLPALYLEESYGWFLGIFPMNIVNKLALVLFGLGGIWAGSLKFNSLPRSILYSRIVFVVMGLGAILGLIPQTNTFFGYWPLFGAEVAVHAIFALMGAYFGFALSIKAKNEINDDPNLRTTFQGGR